MVDALDRASGRAVPRVAGGRIWWEVLAVCLLSSLLYAGLSAELPIDEGLFRERYAVLDRGEVAEIHCWELRPSADRPGR